MEMGFEDEILLQLHHALHSYGEMILDVEMLESLLFFTELRMRN